MEIIIMKNHKIMEEYKYNQEYDLYVSNMGNVMYNDMPKNTFFLTTKNNVYRALSHHSKKILVHRLVGFTWLPNPNNCRMVIHLNGDKLNNKADNLMWSNQSEAELNKIYKLHKEHCLYGKPTKVVCIETSKEYVSINQAAIDINISPTSVKSSCEVGSKCWKKYTFKYISE